MWPNRSGEHKHTHQQHVNLWFCVWEDLCVCICVSQQADGGVTCVSSLALGMKTQQASELRKEHLFLSLLLRSPLPLSSHPSSKSNICSSPLSALSSFTDMNGPVRPGCARAVFRCIGCDSPEAIDTHRVITHSSDCLSSSSGPYISHGHWVLCVYVCNLVRVCSSRLLFSAWLADESGLWVWKVRCWWKGP